ncbi:MAG: DUF4129 domain-containing protein [Bacteroidota bacterium]
MSRKIRTYLFVFTLGLSFGMPPAYADGPIEEAVWEEITKEIDYGTPEGTEMVEIEEEPQRQVRNRDSESFWANFFKVVLIVGLVALIAFIFANMMEGERTAKKRDQKKNQDLQLAVDELEQNLEKASLSPVIREAERTADYPLAIRLHYLKIIQGLAQRDLIRWKREKTNGQYLREIQHPTLRKQFAEATYIFEQIWYGNRTLNEALFKRLRSQLEAIYQSLEQAISHE